MALKLRDRQLLIGENIPWEYGPRELTAEQVAKDNTHGTNWREIVQYGPYYDSTIKSNGWDCAGMHFPPFGFIEVSEWESAEGWKASYVRGPSYCQGRWALGAN